MKTLLPLLAAATLSAAAGRGIRAQAPEPPLVVQDVTVLPMAGAGALAHRSLLVRDGRIVAIEAADSLTVPAGATVVEGRGRYLVPGLIDMHVHPPGSADLVRRMALNGVTTLRVMNGRPQLLALRNRIRDEGLLAPDLTVAGPILEGPPPAGFGDVIVGGYRVLLEPDDAAGVVGQQAADGYDLIKVYNNLTRDAYDGIVAEARRQNLDIVGHVPFAVGLRGALAAGQRTIEHLRGYVQEVVPADAPHQPGPDYRSRLMAWAHADTLRFPELARMTLEAGVWNCPTLTTRRLFLSGPDMVAYLSSPEGRRLPERHSESYLRRHRLAYMSNVDEEDLAVIARGFERSQALVRALRDAGAPLCAGTDVPASGTELHTELDLLVNAGLTPMEALSSATSSAAGALRRDDLGRIVVGARADFLLVDEDPRISVTTLRSPAGLSLRGRWLGRAALDSLREMEAAKDERVIQVTGPDGGSPRVIGRGTRPLAVADGTVYFLSGSRDDDTYAEVEREQGLHPIVRLTPLLATTLDGDPPRRVAEAVVMPDLHRTFDISPGGGRAVVVSMGQDGGGELRLVDLKAGELRPLHRFSQLQPVGPRFSPDGAWVAFTDGDRLFVASTGEDGVRQLGTLAAWDGQVEWSSDGRRVMASGYPEGADGNGIFMAALEGGDLERVTPESEDRFYKEGFAWHPEGSRVAYMCYCGPDQLRLAHVDGRPTERLLLREDHWDWMGAWTPDGRRYVFLGYGERSGLFSLDPASGSVAFLGAADEAPVFVPGAAFMLFAAPGG